MNLLFPAWITQEGRFRSAFWLLWWGHSHLLVRLHWKGLEPRTLFFGWSCLYSTTWLHAFVCQSDQTSNWKVCWLVELIFDLFWSIHRFQIILYLAALGKSSKWQKIIVNNICCIILFWADWFANLFVFFCCYCNIPIECSTLKILRVFEETMVTLVTLQNALSSQIILCHLLNNLCIEYECLCRFSVFNIL